MKLSERLLKPLNKNYEPAWMVAEMNSEAITRLNREYLTSKLISPGQDS